jgi:hypothetical protein
MSLVSVRAIYDGKQIRFLEAPPVHEPYRVLVTFVEPDRDRQETLRDQARFHASFGAWKDERSLEETLKDIHASRRSKAEPPSL